MRVDLPAPFSPRRQWISPGSTVREIESLATTLPKRLVMPRRTSLMASHPRGRDGPEVWTGGLVRGRPGEAATGRREADETVGLPPPWSVLVISPGRTRP